MDKLKEVALWIMLALVLMFIWAYIQKYKVIWNYQSDCFINMEKETNLNN